jgi:ABC-type transporter Mla subunit MlaD/rubrerythrin
LSFNLDFRAQIEGDTEIQKKIDDFVKSLGDLEKAADETTKPLGDAGKAMDDLSKSAGDITKDLGDAEKALSDLQKSAGDVSSDLADTDKAFSDVSASAADVAGELEQADAAFSDIASDADASVSSLDAVNSSFGSVSSAAQEAETNIQAAATGLEGVGTSTEQAKDALDGLGSAFDGAGTATTTFNDVLSSTGTAAQEATGGLTSANTLLGDFDATAQGVSTSTQTASSSMGAMTGTIATMGGTIGSTVQTLFRLEDAQLRLDKANLMVERSTEAARKAHVAFDNLLSTATSNTSAIADARDRLSAALERLNQLEEAGVRSGSEYQAAQAEVAAATAALREQFAAGGGDIEKFDAGINKLTLALDKMRLSMDTSDKAQRGFNQTMLELPTNIVALVGGMIQAGASMGTLAENAKKVGAALKGIGFSSVAASVGTLAASLGAFVGIMALIGNNKEVQNTLKEIHDAANEAVPALKPLNDYLGKTFAGNVEGFTDIWDQFMNLLGVETPHAAEEAKKSLENTSAASQKLTAEQEKAAAAMEATKQTIEGARAGIDGYVEGVTKQVEASTNLTTQMAATNEAMRENISQTLDLVGTQENAGNAMNELGQSYADHQVAIDQLNTTLGTAEGQQLSFQNAVAAGQEKFLQWVQNTRDAATENETFTNSVKTMVNDLGITLPPWMEGTKEDWEALGQAAIGTAEDWEEFEERALESWRSLVSAAEPLFNDLKDAWADVFSRETLNKAQADVDKAIADLNSKMTDLDKELADVLNADQFDPEKWQQVTDKIATTWQTGISEIDAITHTLDPISQVFADMAPNVAATLDEVERNALSFQAKFAQISEMAGETFATNLQANIGLGFEGAVSAASQAVADMLAPFIAEHPELAGMMQPLFDELAQAGPHGAQAVQDVLEKWSGMPGPVGEISGQALTNFQTEFGGKLPGVTKTGVEGAVGELGGLTTGLQNAMVSMLGGIQQQIFKMHADIKSGLEKIVIAIEADTSGADTKISTLQQKIDSIRQGGGPVGTGVLRGAAGVAAGVTAGASVGPQINVDTSPGIAAIDDLQSRIDQMAGKNVTITVDTGPAGIALDGLTSKIDAMAGKNVLITVDTGPAGLAIQGLQSQIDAMAGKSVTITVDIGPAGIAITQLQGQIDAVHGKNVQITVDIGPAGIAITQLQGQIDAVHGKEVQITVDIGPAGIAINQLQGQIDGVQGKNVAITVDIGAALAAINQLQGAINSIQSSMAGLSAYGGGGYGGYGGYGGGGYPQYAFAAGLRPTIFTKPTRMLVGEQGPEIVSVTPMKKEHVPQITAATGISPWSGSGLGTFGYDQMVASLYRQQPQTNPYMSGQKAGQQYGQAFGLWASDEEEEAYKQQMVQQMEAAGQHGQQAGQAYGEGFGQGMQQSMPPMGGGMGGGGGGYPVAPSQIQAMLQGGMSPQQLLAGFGSNPNRYTWTGGAMGTAITPFGGMGGGGGGGAQYPVAPSNTQLWGQPQRFTWTGGAMGTSLGGGFGGGGGGSSGGGMMPWPPTGGGGGQTQQGQPSVYTGQVPASYGKPLGQLINGIAATILAGQGPRGGGMRMAQMGMHEFLKRNTLIKAHKGERVDISPPSRGGGPGERRGGAAGSGSDLIERRIDAIMRLLGKLASQTAITNVSFEVDGRTMSRVASKNMGTYGYGDH